MFFYIIIEMIWLKIKINAILNSIILCKDIVSTITFLNSYFGFDFCVLYKKNHYPFLEIFYFQSQFVYKRKSNMCIQYLNWKIQVDEY